MGDLLYIFIAFIISAWTYVQSIVYFIRMESQIYCEGEEIEGEEEKDETEEQGEDEQDGED